MALHTLSQSAEQKGKPAFLHFQKPSKQDRKPGYININLNDVMKNLGAPQFTYETFTAAYEADDSIKELINNFSSQGIEMNADDKQKPAVSADDDSNKVSQMAKAATDLSDNLG